MTNWLKVAQKFMAHTAKWCSIWTSNTCCTKIFTWIFVMTTLEFLWWQLFLKTRQTRSIIYRGRLQESEKWHRLGLKTGANTWVAGEFTVRAPTGSYAQRGYWVLHQPLEKVIDTNSGVGRHKYWTLTRLTTNTLIPSLHRLYEVKQWRLKVDVGMSSCIQN